MTFPTTISVAAGSEIPLICHQMAAIDPWKRLQITSDMLMQAVHEDSERQILTARHGTEVAGAIMFRPSNANPVLYSRKLAEVLSEYWGTDPSKSSDHFPNAGYVNAIAVFPHCQGQGIGQLLLQAAETRTAEQCSYIYLCVSATNLRAKKFYESFGYEFVGEAHNCLREGNTELLYLKLLGNHPAEKLKL